MGRNRTTVGLKVRDIEDAGGGINSRNRTTVGLKAVGTKAFEFLGADWKFSRRGVKPRPTSSDKFSVR